MSMRKHCPAEVNTITRLVFEASYHFCFTTARAVERRANEPRETQPATHAGVAARQRESV